MTELKTLKELQKDFEWNFDTYNALREEAIKWVKAFEDGKRHTDFASDGRKGQENIIEWINHFFYIEEDEEYPTCQHCGAIGPECECD